MFSREVETGIDHLMDDDAAGIRLVGEFGEFEGLAEAVGRGGEIWLREYRGETILAFETGFAGGEPALRHQRAQQARACRVPREITAGHGAVGLAKAARVGGRET